MRSFIVLCLLAAAAHADVSHIGYNYEQGGHSGGGNVPGSSGLSSGGLSGLGGGDLGGGSLGGGSLGGGSLGGGSLGGGSLGGGSLGGGSLGGGSLGGGSLGGSIPSGSLGGNFVSGSVGGGHRQPRVRVISEPAQVEFVKEFYTFEAPQDDSHDEESIQRVKESLKKHLQVVFIKTPEQRGVEHAALSLAKTASEHNTAIYILQKQPDVSQFSNQLNLIHTHNSHKPEVHIIKYRTQEDAANAQRQIQARYDNLGGSTVHRNGGVPEVLNYASQYAPSYGGQSPVGGSDVGSIAAPAQTYLPGNRIK